VFWRKNLADSVCHKIKKISIPRIDNKSFFIIDDEICVAAKSCVLRNTQPIYGMAMILKQHGRLFQTLREITG
jgi:hypothetical protein